MTAPARPPRGIRVAMVMPPATVLSPEVTLDLWATVTATATGLRADGVDVTVHGRHFHVAADVERDGVTYRFHRSDAALVAAVRAQAPTVVHVHGLGWARLVRRLRVVDAPLLLQHHGEPVFTGRARWGHRLVRDRVAGYLFTGVAEGQAQPWIDAGVLRPDARLFEVLEAASTLPDTGSPPEVLSGAPSVLWVGRLVPGKDPLTALDAFELAASALPHAELHLLATDRDMEAAVRARIEQSPVLAGRAHLHPPVAHERMAAWFRGADVYFSTSRREGSSYSLIEAMTCGCVPVVSAIPPHRVVAGDVGTRFAVGDAAAAARALEAARWATRAPSLERSRIVLSWEHVVGQLVGAYRNVSSLRD